MNYAERKAARAAVTRPVRADFTSPARMNDLDILRKDMGWNNFASSMVAQFDARGDLSPSQWAWVEKLANEQRGRNNDAVAPAPKTDHGKVNEVFDAAKLKFPKIVVQFPNGDPLQLHRAGEKSRTPGSVMLTDGGPFGDNAYYGRVTDGELVLSRDGKARSEELEQVLKSLTGDLGQFAKAHAMEADNCCFCRKDLTHPSSRSAGYGPTCADNYGLPWG